jgi:hypothetical protein
MYMDPSQSWAPFVASEHIGDYVGPSFHLFKEQFGNLADVDNITVVGPVDALEVLIPEGMVSVTAGSYVHSQTPKGMALLLSSPIVFVKETDKKAILDAACRKEFSHFCYRGNSNKKVIFGQAETFTPEQVLKLLRMAKVKGIHFVAYAMKGSLCWAHKILHGLQIHLNNQPYRVMIDFAVTIPPKLLHFARENTHQCAAYDEGDLSTQFLPLTMINRDDAKAQFGSGTQVANFPVLCDAQVATFPGTAPLFGGATIYPKVIPTDMLEKHLSSNGIEGDSEGDESDAHNERPKASPHCNSQELNNCRCVKVYSNYSHLMKQWVGRGRGDPVKGSMTVRDASRIVNGLSKFAKHLIDGGVTTELRFEASVIVPTEPAFVTFDYEGTDSLGMNLLNQFDFAFFPLWKAFHMQRVMLLPIKRVGQSIIRMYLFAALAPLPKGAQIMSGSNDVNQVGVRLPPDLAEYTGRQMSICDNMVFGNGRQSQRLSAYYGQMFEPPQSGARGTLDSEDESSNSIDFDPDWQPQRSIEINSGRTHGGDKVAEAMELKKGGTLSRLLTLDEKCFLALYCANCGLQNKLANSLLKGQFGSGSIPTDNSFNWLTIEVWTHYILLLQSKVNHPYTREEMEQQVFQHLLPTHRPRAAEIKLGHEVMGMIFCRPPAIISSCMDVQDEANLGEGEMFLYLHGRRTNSEFSSIRLGDNNGSCLSIESLKTQLWLRITGGSFASVFACRWSNNLPSASPITEASTENNTLLIAELRRHGRFTETKAGKFLICLKHASKPDGTRLQQGGARFQQGSDFEDALRKTASHIMDQNKKQPWINENNWKDYLNTLANVEELDPSDLLMQEQGNIIAEGERSPNMQWQKQKLECLLMSLLRVHKLETTGRPSLFWAAWNLCSTPLAIRNSPMDVIRAVAKKILDEPDDPQNLRHTWLSKLETEVYADVISDHAHRELSYLIFSRALFYDIIDNGQSLGTCKCIRFNPNFTRGSWRNPFVIGCNKRSCAAKAAAKILDDGLITIWEQVIMLHNSGGCPYNVDSVFTLRSSFLISTDGYNTDITSSISEPVDSDYMAKYHNGLLVSNIVDHSNDSTQNVLGTLSQEALEDDAGGYDQEADDNSLLNWNPTLLEHGRFPPIQEKETFETSDETFSDGDQGNTDFDTPVYPKHRSIQKDSSCVGNESENGYSQSDDNVAYGDEVHDHQRTWTDRFAIRLLPLTQSQSVIVQELDGCQGRFASSNNRSIDSTNGCSVIAALAVFKFLHSGRMDNSDFVSIMDREAPPLLMQLRDKLKYGKHDSINMHDAADHLSQVGYNLHAFFVDHQGGNILSNDLDAVVNIWASDQYQTLGATLHFKGHIVSILKEASKYHFFDSLPHSNGRAIRVTCSNPTLLRRMLRTYAECRLSGESKYCSSNDAPISENDPRIFAANIYALPAKPNCDLFADSVGQEGNVPTVTTPHELTVANGPPSTVRTELEKHFHGEVSVTAFMGAYESDDEEEQISHTGECSAHDKGATKGDVFFMVIESSGQVKFPHEKGADLGKVVWHGTRRAAWKRACDSIISWDDNLQQGHINSSLVWLGLNNANANTTIAEVIDTAMIAFPQLTDHSSFLCHGIVHSYMKGKKRTKFPSSSSLTYLDQSLTLKEVEDIYGNIYTPPQADYQSSEYDWATAMGSYGITLVVIVTPEKMSTVDRVFYKNLSDSLSREYQDVYGFSAQNLKENSDAKKHEKPSQNTCNGDVTANNDICNDATVPSEINTQDENAILIFNEYRVKRPMEECTLAMKQSNTDDGVDINSVPKECVLLDEYIADDAEGTQETETVVHDDNGTASENASSTGNESEQSLYNGLSVFFTDEEQSSDADNSDEDYIQPTVWV